MVGSAPEASQRQFYLLLIAASCALSALAILRDPVINDDGVFYLMLARQIADGGVGVLTPADGPLYPILIAALHRATGLSLLVSAHLVDAALLALLVTSFTRFTVAVCGERALAPWAALLVLLYPQLNEYRGFVIREFGFWALLLTALLPLLRYRESQRWRHGIAWTLLSAAAAAFRPEALVYLLLLPWACQRGDTPGARAMSVARLYACIGVVALPPLLVLARFDLLQAPLDAALVALEGLAHSIVEGFRSAVAVYAETVLDHRVAGFAPASLAAGLLTVLAMKFAVAFGAIYCGLLAWGVATGRAGLPSVARGTWRVLLGTALLIVATVVLARQFVATRHVVMLCLLALIPGALVLRALAENAARERLQGRFYLLLVAAIALLAADGFVSFGTRKDYRHQAIAWMQANVSADARVFSNDRILAFYSGGRFAWDEVLAGDALIAAHRAPLEGVTYWVLQRDSSSAAIDAALPDYQPRLTALARFDNGRDARIEVYRVEPGTGPG